MVKRKLEELNLLDDFLFGAVVSYPEIGERFSRELLKIIFQKDFGKLEVVPQKMYYGSDTDLHGMRMDVYLEENTDDSLPENATVYDVEPDNTAGTKERKAIPRRMRFYHALIDARSLKSGEDYHSLKNVIIIMITPFDPLGYGQMMYTVQNRCLELPDMPYDDGAKTVFLYTKGKADEKNEALAQLLRYIEWTVPENAVNPDLQEMQKMVETVKRDREVSVKYMKIFEREQMLRQEAIEEGMREGIRKGIKTGRMEERANTDRERRRADKEQLRADKAEQEILRLQEELERVRTEHKSREIGDGSIR